MDLVKYICTNGTFHNHQHPYTVRWLDWDRDYELSRAYWGQEYQATFRDIWRQAKELGYEYCAIVEQEEIAAIAGVWRFSDDAWDLAAVNTKEKYRQKGYGKAVCAFITSYILTSGRIATCETGIQNLPMQKLAESLGYFKPSSDYKIKWPE